MGGGEGREIGRWLGVWGKGGNAHLLEVVVGDLDLALVFDLRDGGGVVEGDLVVVLERRVLLLRHLEATAWVHAGSGHVSTLYVICQFCRDPWHIIL